MSHRLQWSEMPTRVRDEIGRVCGSPVTETSSCVGAPWFDLVCMLPSIELEGGGTPESVLELAGCSDIDSAALLPVIVAIAGYFVAGGRRPDPPGLPTVREFQRAQGRVALAWLRRTWSHLGVG